MLQNPNPPLTPKFGHLNTLANYCDDLPSDRMFMPAWCSPDATETSCGTAGCAGGIAVNLFHREGLRLGLGRLRYGDHCGSSAFAEFFGIPYPEAHWITVCLEGPGPMREGDSAYCEEYHLAAPEDIAPRHVADRIRKVIRKLGGEVTIDYPIPEREVASCLPSVPAMGT